MNTNDALMKAAMAQLDALLQTPAADRAAFLSDLAKSQPQLHAIVMQLYQAERDASGGGFLEPPVGTQSNIQPDMQLGAYRIIKKLGAGGMGEVWLASRNDDSHKSTHVDYVAIKTLHAHLTNTTVRERFTREAHILGKLTHKNIARLLDADVTDAGITYLVLEYVQGEALDSWCDARSLSIRARLELFLSVCSAVAHAHMHLVVHRDLKPSNILVAQSGGVKLLDFGVAKLVHSDTSNIEPTALTQLGGRIFTPEYATPEQILGDAVTTATDVYALGLLLYELLSGKRPFSIAGTTGRALEQAIINTEPPALAILPSALTDVIARQRSTTPLRLNALLQGDLQFIVARALRKAPKDRYSSVLALAVDVERYLQQQPIEARAGSNAYQLGQFVRRHRVWTAAISGVVLAMIVGVSGVLWQAREARAQASKATAVKNFLISVFQHNSTLHPDGSRARKTTAEEMLAQASQQIRSGLNDAPSVRAEMLGVMADLYAQLEMQPEAIELRQSQLNELRKAHGNQSIAVANSMTELAFSQLQQGDYSAAEKTAKEAEQIFTARGDTSSIQFAKTLDVLGLAAFRVGRVQDGTATRYFETALRIVEQHHPSHYLRLEVLLSLARTATLRKQPEQSLHYCQQAIKLIETNQIAEVGGIDRGAVYQVTSVRLRGVHRYAEAETFIARATAEFERAGGVDHPFTIDSRREHGSLFNIIGRRVEARALLVSSIAALERTKGIDDPELTTNARIFLSQVLIARGELIEAEPHIVRAQRVVEASHATTLSPAIKLTLGRLQIAQGKFADAERTLTDLEPLSISIGGEGSPRHALALVRLGQFALATKRYDDANKYFSKLNTWPEQAGQLSSGRANARVGLVRLALEQGATKSALDQAQALLPEIEASWERPEMPDAEVEAKLLLGVAMMKTGNVTGAIPHLERVVAERERMDAPQSPWLAEARLYWAQALHRTNHERAADKQLDLAKRAFAMHSALAPQYPALFAETRAVLAQ